MVAVLRLYISVIFVVLGLAMSGETQAQSDAYLQKCEQLEQAGYQNSGFYEDNHPRRRSLPESDFFASATPESQNIDSKGLKAAAEKMRRSRQPLSLLVLRNNKLVFEHYFNGADKNAAHNIHSASKGMMSAAIGIAINEGLIAGEQALLKDLLPGGYREPASKGDKAKISLHDLLAMQAGLKWTEDSTEYKIENKPDWIRAILERKQAAQPGQVFNYNTGLTHLMSAILQEQTGRSACRYVSEKIFAPLGISLEHWGMDPQGYFSGGYNVYMTARDLAKFAQLYVNEGRSQNGQEVVPAEWVRRSLQDQADVDGDYTYGYNFWIRTIAGERVAMAWGFGGQRAFILPQKKLVVVITTDTQNFETEYAAEKILKNHILPAVR